jgi:hypothetical protein
MARIDDSDDEEEGNDEDEAEDEDEEGNLEKSKVA